MKLFGAKMIFTRFTVVLALVLLLAALVISYKNTNENQPELGKDQSSQLHFENGQTFRSLKRASKDSPMTADALCERFKRAVKNETVVGVHQKIVDELKRLDAERLLTLLAEVDQLNLASGDEGIQIYARGALLAALSSISRESAAAYLTPLCIDFHLSHSADELIRNWLATDPKGLIHWLDDHRDDLLGHSEFLTLAESDALTFLITKDQASALDRIDLLPSEHARDIVLKVFKRRSRLLDPDQAIIFLREALSRKDHEDAVGEACGWWFYEKDEAEIQAFFQRHHTTIKEGEAILFQSVKAGIKIGRGEEPVSVYHQRMRALAEAEGFGNANELSAVILGVTVDRDHQDKRAVDELLSFDPDIKAIEIFIETSGSSLGEAQRGRINERLSELAE